MKKITTVLILALVSLCFTMSADAQRIRFGLKGGVNLSKSNIKEIAAAGLSETYTGFNAGIVLNLRLILGFSIQPELIYTQSGMKFLEAADRDYLTAVTHGVIELPVNIQWGIKLGPVRPYAQVSPYIGYSVLNREEVSGSISRIENSDKFQYGIGLGFGIDIWKFQLAYRYKWDLNSLEKNAIVGGLNLGDHKVRTSEISLAFFF